MKINDLIIQGYKRVIPRIKRWILPLTLVLAYLSGFAQTQTVVFRFVKRIELTSIHYFCGMLLLVLWLVLMYNSLYLFLSKKRTYIIIAGKKKRLKEAQRKGVYEGLVNFTFYLAFFIVCSLGMIAYGVQRGYLPDLVPYQNFSFIIHRVSSWFFLSVLSVKYYLSITRWYYSLIHYLKEF